MADIHICGMCRAQFTDIDLFVQHKKQHDKCLVQHQKQTQQQGAAEPVVAMVANNSQDGESGSTEVQEGSPDLAIPVVHPPETSEIQAVSPQGNFSCVSQQEPQPQHQHQPQQQQQQQQQHLEHHIGTVQVVETPSITLAVPSGSLAPRIQTLPHMPSTISKVAGAAMTAASSSSELPGMPGVAHNKKSVHPPKKKTPNNNKTKCSQTNRPKTKQEKLWHL